MCVCVYWIGNTAADSVNTRWDERDRDEIEF